MTIEKLPPVPQSADPAVRAWLEILRLVVNKLVSAVNAL